MNTSIRRLQATDALAYWTLRNRGLKDHPDVFTTSYEEGLATPPEKLAKRFGGKDSDDFMMGAFSEAGELLGFVGLKREDRVRTRHSALVIGMYLAPENRGHGVAKQLMHGVIAEARAMPGLEQLTISVTHSNQEARNLYLGLGFQPFGIEPRAVKVGEIYYDKEFMLLSLI